MRRFNVIITGCSVLTLLTACASASQPAPRHDPATVRTQRHAAVQGAVARTRTYGTGRGMPSPGGQPRSYRLPPAWRSCSHPPVAEASDPLPCAPMLLVPIVL